MTLALYGLVMLLAMTMAGIIGFAANVIALPFLSLFLPLDLVVPMLVFFAALQSGFQAWRVRRDIHWRELGHILLFVFIGMPIGFLLLHYLPELLMKGLLGLFVAATSIKGLVDNARGKMRTTFIERPWHKLLLICGGCLNGAFGCGGPLTVVYTHNRYRDKDTFRAMQFGCGTCTMGMATIGHAFTGGYTAETLPYMIVGLAAVAIAVNISTRLVRHMETGFFQQFVNAVLLLSALSLLWQVAQGLA